MSEPENNGKLVLPEDEPRHLFVLSMASNSMMYRMFTGERYRNEVLSQEVTSLSRLPRDTDASYTRRLAAEQRDAATIADIYSSGIIRRPPNWLVILAVALVGVGLIAYGQYNPGFSLQFTTFWNVNSGYIIVGTILFIALLLMLRFRRRRRRVG